jgi:hypothetical protein
MLAKTVLISLVVLLLTAYWATPLLSLSARRRRDARALRRWLLRDIEAGRHEVADATVTHVLHWCDEVATTGADLPLLPQPHR